MADGEKSLLLSYEPSDLAIGGSGAVLPGPAAAAYGLPCQPQMPRHLGLVRVGARSVLGASTLSARTSTLDASALDAWCFDARCTHLDARRSVHAPRRFDARCTHLDARRFGARRYTRRSLDARCTYLDARRFGASTLGARTSTLGARVSKLGAHTSTLDASALDTRCTHLEQPCPGFTVVLPARLSCRRVIPMRTA
ncbi:UNVERIFIED_CONTAM: hypothetical protein FKN15_034259 [Acipenser sinensis]